ncbi:MAG: DUF881 domain-containing protein [Armatimonadetes bacterium]|nr:DUF881 domain-containing protein [Armatimonadota bacterium]
MSKQTSIGFIFIATLSVALCGACCAFSNAEEPSAASIAEALKAQEVACGKSLVVNYNITFGPADHRFTETNKYIRTADVLVHEDNGIWSSKETYNKTTKESKCLFWFKGKIENGTIKNGIEGTIFSTQSFIETSRFALYEGALCDIIRSGKISATKEDVDGFQCWRVDIAPKVKAFEKYAVWVDPNIGFCPRLIKIIGKTSPPIVIAFKDYKQVGAGVWFPKKLNVDAMSPDNVAVNSECNVTDIQIDQSVSKDDMRLDFPLGTEVQPGYTNAAYIWRGRELKTPVDPRNRRRASDSHSSGSAFTGIGKGIRVTLINGHGSIGQDLAKYLVYPADVHNIVLILFAAGAKAVSVGGWRVTPLSWITDEANGVISAGGHRVREPWVIEAVGDPKALSASLAKPDTSAADLFVLKMIKVASVTRVTVKAELHRR